MDIPTQIVPSALQYAYGPVADSYAQKYGIPPDMFRQAIQARSGFDPQYNGPNGQGIAGLSFTQPGSVSPNDVGGSLDAAAKIITGMYKSTGDWQSAIDQFLGKDEATQAEAKAAQAQDATADNSILGKITSYLKGGAFTIMIVIVGLVLIIGSVWVIINQKGK